MKKHALTAFGIFAMWLAGGHAFAAEPMTFQSGDMSTTLIELFTSEGCSSCPAAEKWLSRFKTNPDLWKKIVPVAFHVDYWDRLGWADRFAKAEFTERQQRYAEAWRGDSVYTPGFAVDGKEWRGFFNGAALPPRNEKVGSLRITLTNETQIAANFTSETPAPRPFTFEAVLLGTNLESDVKRGENTGRKLHHDFVVLQLARVEMIGQGNHWTGSFSLPAKSNDKPDAIAAWVTPPDGSGPIQATGGWITAPR
jgi:hypothetical protein